MDIVDRIRQDVPGEHSIISRSAKGIIRIKFKNDGLFLFDMKTHGYPQKKFVGHYLLRGGNWNTPEDLTPKDTYARELREEFKALDDVKDDGNTVRWLNNTIVENARPLAEYAYIIPPEVHGNVKKGIMSGVESIFYTEVDGDELVDRLGILANGSTERTSRLTHALTVRSPESPAILISEIDLRAGKTTGYFAFGDEIIFGNYLRNMFGYRTQIPIRAGVVKEETRASTPLTPHAEVPYLDLLHVNPIREGKSPDSKVYTP